MCFLPLLNFEKLFQLFLVLLWLIVKCVYFARFLGHPFSVFLMFSSLSIFLSLSIYRSCLFFFSIRCKVFRYKSDIRVLFGVLYGRIRFFFCSTTFSHSLSLFFLRCVDFFTLLSDHSKCQNSVLVYRHFHTHQTHRIPTAHLFQTHLIHCENG